MSTTAVQEFLAKVAEDESLQSDLTKAIEADNDREAVTQLGNSKGYDFTADELWAEIQQRQSEVQKRQEAGELSDEELEAVAGGEVIIAATIATAIGSVAGGTSFYVTYTIGKNSKW